jgi:prolyl-tRNA synthetase
MGPGPKLKDAQLYGYPLIIIVGAHTQHDDDLFEVQDRQTGKTEVLSFNELQHVLRR